MGAVPGSGIPDHQLPVSPWSFPRTWRRQQERTRRVYARRDGFGHRYRRSPGPITGGHAATGAPWLTCPPRSDLIGELIRSEVTFGV